MIETLVISQMNKNREDFHENKNPFANLSPASIVIALLISVAAAYFAFECNSHEKPATRFVYTLIAFFFPGLYLIYYFIRHVILGDKCKGRQLFDGRRRSRRRK
jgi:RsiW-degrading membrane proteinase PrsW (M82 family)